MADPDQRKFKKPGPKVIIAAGALVLISAALFAANAFLQKQPAQVQAEEISLTSETPQETRKALARLSGFEPGARVQYKVLSMDADPISSTMAVNSEGGLDVTVPKQGAGTQDKMYGFTVEESGRQVAVILKQDPVSGTMSLEGRAAPFTAVQIGIGDKKIDTKTDWAGLFSETGITFEKQEEKQESVPVQVAFFNNNIATDGRDYQSKAIIQVLTAPGGGGPTNSNVNQWSESLCSPYALSTCRTGKVNSQNKAIVDNFVFPLMQMTEQLTVVAAQEVAAIGMFLDAKQQLETQRLHQQLKTEAVKDYHPSEQMCRIGSYIRSLANVEERVVHNQFVLNDMLIENEDNRINTGTALGPESDFENRIDQYRTTYCDPSDNNEGLDILCKHPGGTGAATSTRVNNDVDYQRVLEMPYTLDIDFTDNTLTPEEADIVALGRNLYWDTSFDFASNADLDKNSKYYMRARAFRAMNNVAHNSFSNYVAMKAKAPDPVAPVQPGWMYMKTLMREFGMSDPDIEQLIGKNPSYYAQMDFLTKKMFQNPDFFTNLYDKPVNVDRIEIALNAIGLMQMRDHYEASLRHEMLLSGLVENQLLLDSEKISGKLLDAQ